jgi:DNA-binding protein H-NS
MPRTTSLKLIQAQIAALEAKADALKNADKPGIKQLRGVISKFKLSPADVKLALNGHGRKRSALAGTKVKPKYRNPAEKAQTWTGRGRQPLWLVAASKSGKKLDSFLIKYRSPQKKKAAA